MHIQMPKSQTEQNIESIKYAIDKKLREVEEAQNNLTNLKAELRGLRTALEVIGGNNAPATPISSDAYNYTS